MSSLSIRSFVGIQLSLFFLFVPALLTADEAATAKIILDASTIKNGLCVHLGVTDGKLTAALAKQWKFLVHGIALDEASLEKARQYLQAQGIYGQASIEQLSSPAKLPYADNLVNILIADDLSKLLKSGLTIQEIMRVICPNGVALIGQVAGVAGISEVDLKAKLIAAGIKEIEWVKQG
ncbi:MAG: methyltransferase domain-containing protein, partial [Planctomycetota bacterium]